MKYDLTVNEFLNQTERKALLISGYPCSGKTTFAYANFPADVIVDDPVHLDQIDFSRDVLVITDPHLTLDHVRNKAVELLDNQGYVVYTLHIDTPVDVCLERAKTVNRKVTRYIKYLARSKTNE